MIAEAARRSEGTSCAFIKELMRRLAQGSIARDGGNTVISADIDEALDDMLFSGGRQRAAARRRAGNGHRVTLRSGAPATART